MIRRVQADAQVEVARAVKAFASNHSDARVLTFPLSSVATNATAEENGAAKSAFDDMTNQYAPMTRASISTMQVSHPRYHL